MLLFKVIQKVKYHTRFDSYALVNMLPTRVGGAAGKNGALDRLWPVLHPGTRCTKQAQGWGFRQKWLSLGWGFRLQTF